MNFNSPKQIVEVVGLSAQARTRNSTSTTLVLAFLGGAYIALGGLLAIVIGGGVPGISAENPGISKFLMGATFPVGLMLVAIAGGELFTGNTAYFIPPVASGRLKLAQMLRNWGLVYLGNFFGALFVAYFVGYLTGALTAEPWKEFTINIANVKTTAPFYKVFFKGMACNWFVAIAMWLAYASNHISGKILGIWFPIMAFVAMGFEHCIANMFFIPSAMLLGAPITWGDFIVNNLIPATLGNIAGGSILVGLLYWYAYGENKI